MKVPVGINDPFSFTTVEATSRTAGQTDVTGDPATYSLYTTSELVIAALTARALKKDDIINNPTIHGLFGENTVEDVSVFTSEGLTHKHRCAGGPTYLCRT